uniref:Small ribosomal subunit protein bS16 n=1 Tax=candidate division WOR-3 bacterium TaxID=2052148 RepID=A0A7C2K3B0_UNCW3
MVKIRLQRVGRSGLPLYRIVVQDARVARNGKVIEVLGHYNPLKDITELNTELLEKWLSQGAQMTPRVAKLYKFYKKIREQQVQ